MDNEALGRRTPRPERAVKSADRAVDVLELLAVSGELSLGTISQRLRIPKSSLHGLVRTLEARGWLDEDKVRLRFRIGLHALVIANAFVGRDPAIANAQPILDWLADATGETVQLARLDKQDVVYLDKRPSIHPVTLMTSVGSRLPAHTTALGKALLSERTVDELDRLLTFPMIALTERSIRTRQRLLDELEAVRKRGYAIDEEEAAPGLCCFATVLPGQEPPTDAVSISLPKFRATREVRTKLIKLMLEVPVRTRGSRV